MQSHLPERICLGIFAVWLLWLPLPFGSNEDFARTPLIVVPLAICALTAFVRIGRAGSIEPCRAWKIWSVGGLLLVVVILIQLIPLSPSLLRAVSPESDTIWRGASRVASLIDHQPQNRPHPITIDPLSTVRELFRFIALLATFQAASLLVRNETRRLVLAGVLSVAALFQMLYALREGVQQHYEIWGWKNTLIFHRISGTFVNPNHFAHYVAITAPMALYIAAMAWHRSAPGAPISHRVTRLVEHHALMFGAGFIVAGGCLAAILVAQSRGGLLAVGCGTIGVAAMAAGQRREGSALKAMPRVAAVTLGGIALGALVVTAMIIFLGRERTVGRFKPSEVEEVTLVGRRTGIEAAIGIWWRFPIFGSGFGTFPHIVSMTQKNDVAKTYDHAHDDYAEIAATTGTLGGMIALVAIAGGYGALSRSALRRGGGVDASWGRRAFQVVALISITIALVHAFVDFNFYIPANAATLAAIAGAAVPLRSSSYDDTMRTRR
jgi:hypothetical protein